MPLFGIFQKKPTTLRKQRVFKLEKNIKKDFEEIVIIAQLGVDISHHFGHSYSRFGEKTRNKAFRNVKKELFP